MHVCSSCLLCVWKYTHFPVCFVVFLVLQKHTLSEFLWINACWAALQQMKISFTFGNFLMGWSRMVDHGVYSCVAVKLNTINTNHGIVNSLPLYEVWDVPRIKSGSCHFKTDRSLDIKCIPFNPSIVNQGPYLPHSVGPFIRVWTKTAKESWSGKNYMSFDFGYDVSECINLKQIPNISSTPWLNVSFMRYEQT